jgi:hypothetical protein
MDTNPGSRCIITTRMVPENPSSNPRFHGMFMALNASVQGFLNGCRPFIGKSFCIVHFLTLFFLWVLFLSEWLWLDGCFVKLTTGQQILAATGRDGNNNIFPIAFGLVDKEDRASWTWFLTQLKAAIWRGLWQVWTLHHYQ